MGDSTNAHALDEVDIVWILEGFPKDGEWDTFWAPLAITLRVDSGGDTAMREGI